MTPNLIETLKASIYSPKHTQNKKVHVSFVNLFKTFENPYFQQNKKTKNIQRVVFIFYSIIHILC